MLYVKKSISSAYKNTLIHLQTLRNLVDFAYIPARIFSFQKQTCSRQVMLMFVFCVVVEALSGSGSLTSNLYSGGRDTMLSRVLDVTAVPVLATDLHIATLR